MTVSARAVCGLTLAACLLASPFSGDARAQYFGRNKVEYRGFNFQTLRTDHFDIYYYPREEAAARQAARMAERWYARFSELLDHQFTHRQPIVLYASHRDFTQTNVSSGTVDEGTGGFTERLKSRIVMPFAPGLGETDHVIGHELAHAFQIDIEKQAHLNAFELPGCRIVRNIGVVRGIVVRSRSIIGTLGASLQTLVGGNITLFTQMCERAREDAFRLMLEHAAEHGANALVGVRYDANEVAAGVTEVLAYGTAVIVEAADGR